MRTTLVAALALGTLLLVGPRAGWVRASAPIEPLSPRAIVTDSARIYLPALARDHSLEQPGRRKWGLQFQLEFIPEFHIEDVVVELPRAREAGISSVRTNVYWEHVEPLNVEPADYDWSEPDGMLRGYSREGFDLLVTLVAYPPWATRYRCGGGLNAGMETEWREFVRAAAERYGSGYNVVAWEIGNEPDGTTRIDTDDWERPPGWGQGEPTTPHGGCWGEIPAEYARFLTAAAEEISAADPDALVTYGGLAYQDWAHSFNMDFIDGLLAAGGGPAIDFHNYHSFAHFWNMPGQPTGVGKHESLMARLRPYGEDTKPVWLTETYRATFDADESTIGAQVPFLTRDLVELLGRDELERVYWYAWVDTPDDIGDGAIIGRGLIGPDRVPKPAFSVLPLTIELTNGDARDLSSGPLRLFEFRRDRAAKRSYAAWSTDGHGEVRVPVPVGWQTHVTRFPVEEVLVGACCARTPVAADGGWATVPVTGEGTFVEVEAP